MTLLEDTLWFEFNPIEDDEGEGIKKIPHSHRAAHAPSPPISPRSTSFLPVTSKNVGMSPKIFSLLLLSHAFDTLV